MFWKETNILFKTCKIGIKIIHDKLDKIRLKYAKKIEQNVLYRNRKTNRINIIDDEKGEKYLQLALKYAIMGASLKNNCCKIMFQKINEYLTTI